MNIARANWQIAKYWVDKETVNNNQKQETFSMQGMIESSSVLVLLRD